jgi:hypothetical protein
MDYISVVWNLSVSADPAYVFVGMVSDPRARSCLSVNDVCLKHTRLLVPLGACVGSSTELLQMALLGGGVPDWIAKSDATPLVLSSPGEFVLSSRWSSPSRV